MRIAHLVLRLVLFFMLGTIGVRLLLVRSQIYANWYIALNTTANRVAFGKFVSVQGPPKPRT